MIVCVILASAHDLHADAVIDCLHDTCCVVRVDPFAHNQLVTFDSRTSICSIDATTFNVSQVAGVYCRVALEAINYDFIDGVVERFSASEWLCALTGILLLVSKRKWINSPWIESVSDGKINPLLMASQNEIRVPSFIVSCATDQLIEFVDSVGNCIIKPLSDRSIAFQDNRFIEDPQAREFLAPYTADFDVEKCTNPLADDITPTLIQEKIMKTGDLRIVVVDDQVFGTFLPVSSPTVDSRMVDREAEHAVKLEHSFCSTIREFVCKRLKLRFCTLDFVRSVDGHDYLIDVNPSGNWLWQENKFMLQISSAVACALLRSFDEIGKLVN